MSTTPPGWYQDPYGRAQLRWWSGTTWTSQVSTNGQQFEDAPGGAVAAVVSAAPALTSDVGAGVGAPSAGTVAVPPAAPVRSGAGSGMLALIAVAALLVGVLLGYVMRGGGDSDADSDGGGGGGGTTTVRDGDASDGGDGGGGSTGSLAAPLFKSLTNLDSLEYRMSATTKGPTVDETSLVESTGSRDAATKSNHQTQTSTTTSEGETDVSTTESWSVDDVTCTFTADSDPQYESESRNPFELDISGTLPGIFDVVLVSENAQLVGTEQLAGVEVEHYTFTIDGLGQGSGQQVTANSGEMWVATDGDYVVKYQVNAGLRTAPEGTPDAELFELALTFELTSVNQPVSVTLPPDCPPPSDDTSS